jgi:hypothetical protein
MHVQLYILRVLNASSEAVATMARASVNYGSASVNYNLNNIKKEEKRINLLLRFFSPYLKKTSYNSLFPT